VDCWGFVAVVVHGNDLWTSGSALLMGRVPLLAAAGASPGSAGTEACSSMAGAPLSLVSDVASMELRDDDISSTRINAVCRFEGAGATWSTGSLRAVRQSRESTDQRSRSSLWMEVCVSALQRLARAPAEGVADGGGTEPAGNRRGPNGPARGFRGRVDFWLARSTQR
jgi:hypothetical protein